MTERILEDEELGALFVRVNARARRLTFRTKEDGVYVTIPPGTTSAELDKAIEQLRPRLRIAKQKQRRPIIDLDYRIDTEFFKLTLLAGRENAFCPGLNLARCKSFVLLMPISQIKRCKPGCGK